MNAFSAPALLLFVSLAAFATAGCSSDTTSSSSSDGGTESATPASNDKVVAGITIPSTLKLCTQSLTATSSSTSSGFSWKAVPTATRYAVRATKAAKDATVTTELFNDFVTGTDAGASYTFPERVSGTSYMIEVYAIAGSDPVCQLDGVNGITV